MARTTARQKESYGTIRVNHFSPALTDKVPKSINIVLSFEEAMKLHLGLQDILLDLNSLNRATVAGRRTGVNLCVHREQNRITINRDTIHES
jgi:hypothetical protein